MSVCIVGIGGRGAAAARCITAYSVETPPLLSRWRIISHNPRVSFSFF
jgi:hypothetical protein